MPLQSNLSTVKNKYFKSCKLSSRPSHNSQSVSSVVGLTCCQTEKKVEEGGPFNQQLFEGKVVVLHKKVQVRVCVCIFGEYDKTF